MHGKTPQCRIPLDKVFGLTSFSAALGFGCDGYKAVVTEGASSERGSVN